MRLTGCTFHAQVNTVRIIFLWQHGEHPAARREPLTLELSGLEAEWHGEQPLLEGNA